MNSKLELKTRLYYENGWRLLSEMRITGMRLDQITRGRMLDRRLKHLSRRMRMKAALVIRWHITRKFIAPKSRTSGLFR